jgi:hypothetical protein
MAGANTEMLPMATIPMHETTLAAPHSAGIERGTPQYYGLQKAIRSTARDFLLPKCRGIALACPDPEIITPLIKGAAGMSRFITLAPSVSASERALDAFRFEVGLGSVEVGHIDLERNFPEVLSHLTLCMEGLAGLTEARQDQILSLVFRHLDGQGGFILVENESDGKDWETALREAGFEGVRTIWRSGQLIARLATKRAHSQS